METGTVTINGVSYKLNFPSLRRARQLSEVLGHDIFKRGIGDYAWEGFFADFDKVKAALTVCLETYTEELLDKFTAADMMVVLTAFFLSTKRTNAERSDALAPLVDTINARSTFKLPNLSPSMPPFTTSQTETPSA